MILDGKKTAKKITDIIKNDVSNLKIKPGLAVILANDNDASKIYVKNKERKALELGFTSKIYKFNKDVKENEILSLIEKLNNDKKTNGVLVQLPLFKHLDENKIINSINPVKDVDGFHPLNIGKLFLNQTPYAVACTPKGIITLLKEYNIDLKGKNVLIAGRSNIVGKPLIALLLKEDATVSIAHGKTKNLKELCLNNDIIISATGNPFLIKEDMVNENSIVIDVGINKINGKTVGDVDFENVKNKVYAITPVPGGIGPMTISMLMKNTFELFLKQKESEAK